MGLMVIGRYSVIVYSLEKSADICISETTRRPTRSVTNMYGTTRDITGTMRLSRTEGRIYQNIPSLKA